MSEESRRLDWTLVTAFLMGIPNWFMFVLMLWYRAYPDPTRGPDMMQRLAELVTGWLSFVIIGTSALTLGLQSLIAFRWMNARQLKGKVAELEATNQQLTEQTKQRELQPSALPDPSERQTIKRLETDLETKEFQRMGILLEKNMLADKVEELEEAKKLAYQKLKQEEIHTSNWMQSCNKAERDLAELQYVVKIIEEQKSALQDHVVILRDFKVRVDLIDTMYGPPRIRFGFKIRNEALPNITIHEKGVGGKVYFRAHPLTETCRFDPIMASDVENIKHLNEGSLYLDQKLTASEIDRISKALEANPNAEFGFEHVSIKVSGGDNFPYEATKPLHIPGDYQRVKLTDCQINSNTENP